MWAKNKKWKKNKETSLNDCCIQKSQRISTRH